MINQQIKNSWHLDQVSNPALTLIDLLRRRADGQPDHLAYTFLASDGVEEAHLTYLDLDRGARKIGAWLQSFIMPGERVLLLFPSGPDYIKAFFGCLYAGAVAVPAYPPRRNRNLQRLQSIVIDSQAAVALTTDHLLGRLRPLSLQDSRLTELAWKSTDAIADVDENDWRRPEISSASLAMLQYTSGSTSVPKGVMLSHRNLLYNEQIIQNAFQQDQDSVIVGWLPLYHDMGLIGNIIQPLFVGARSVVMSPMSFLQRPAHWLQVISKYRATTSGGPSFAYELCVRKVTDEQRADLDLSCWKVAFNGSEPIKHETIERFAAAFQPCGFRREAFYPCYGLAEATLLVSCRSKSDPVVIKALEAQALETNRVVVPSVSEDVSRPSEAYRSIVSCGVSPEQQVVIIDPETLTGCSPDRVGEVWVSSPSIAEGYWNRPDETKITFQAYIADTGEGPFLRTGDLGFLWEEQLFITGRLKDLIIIRGLNYYPQDIEGSVEQCHKALRPGCGAAFSFESENEERLGIVQEVELQSQLNLDEVIAKIIEAVSDGHDLQAHAIALIKTGTIPKTTSGKIQRHASRAALLEGSLSVLAEWRAPSGSISEVRPPAPADSEMSAEAITGWLQSLLAAKLRIRPHSIDVNQPIICYGVDSLTAIELMHSVEEGTGVSLPLTIFLQNPTIAGLAALVKGRPASDPRISKAISPRLHEAITEYPLSLGQRALWFIHQIAPESGAYNLVAAARIISKVDAAALKRAFQILSGRHACLRTTFIATDGAPIQQVRRDSTISFRQEDATCWSEASLNNYLVEQAYDPFDLSRGPLLRVALLKRSAEDHILIFTLHHIVADFWSLAVLAHELGIVYQAEVTGCPASLAPPTSEYADFVRWQEEILAGYEGRRLEAYWLEQLNGELPTLNLPTDRLRPPEQTYNGASHLFRLNAEVTHELKALSQGAEATLYTVLLAAFQALLHRYTSQNDILVGSPTAGRSRSDLARTIGYFVNPVVLRAKVDGGTSFEDFLKRMRPVVLGALEHHDYPFGLLIDRLQPERDPSRSPIFQVMFVLQKVQLLNEKNLASFAIGEAGVRMKLGGLDLESLALPKRTAQFDLTLVMAESDDSLLGSFEYNTDLFDPVTIRRTSDHLQSLIESILTDKSERISDLSLLTKSEVNQLLVEWNDTAADYLRKVCLHTLFEAQVIQSPHAGAVVFEGRRFTYAELNERANQLARYLRDSGAGPDVAVGIYCERSVNMVIGLLAILKAGSAYLPLDPSYPKERLSFMVENARVRIVLVEDESQAGLDSGEARVVCLGRVSEFIEREDKENLRAEVGEENLAYVIYTSGSTGRPKGAMITHRGICNRLLWIQQEYPIGPNDRVLQKTPFSFDVSVWEFFWPLITGACLVVAKPDGHKDAAYLVDLITNEQITTTHFVPSMLRQTLAQENVSTCVSLKRVICSGEALPYELQEAFMSRLNAELLNLYGPTEASVEVTYWECKAHEKRVVPIGKPIANTQIYLLDQNLHLVPSGVIGELHIAGVSLARGYINGPDLTAEKFIPNPFGREPGSRLYKTGDLARHLPDGSIEFLGRLDFQVKIRGFRIEMEEIESRLKSHPLIRDAAVIARDDGESGKARSANERRLVAYVVAGGGQAPLIGEMRNHIKQALPEYMVPSAFVFLDSLPLTSSGKLNRLALPAPEGARPRLQGAFVAPRNSSEKILADIWAGLLGLESVGIHDNFFELGGDSILSIQVIGRANQSGLSLTAKQLFQYQTIAELAEIAERALPIQAEQGDVSGAVPLAPIQQWFFEQNFTDARHWNQYVLLEATQPIDTPLLEKALGYVLAHHDVLRSRFKETENGWEQVITKPEGGVPLCTANLSGMSEQEQASAIEKWADEAQAGLSFGEGEMVKVVQFKRGEEKPDRLLIVIHHLVTDAVSYRFILDDLDRAYTQLSGGQEIKLPLKTTSFKHWAQKLKQYAESAELDQELDYWLSRESLPVPALPVDHPGGINTAASARTISIELSEDETRILLQEVMSAYRVKIDELLLTAFLLSYEGWGGGNTLLIDLEGHGREEVVGGVNLSRTVGWFTTICPIILHAPNKLTTNAALKQVKEQVRSLPQKGIGYGLLRYGARAEVRERMRALPRAEMCFNFLGQLDQALRMLTSFSVESGMIGLSTSPSARRPYLIEINGSIIGGRARMNWTYSENMHRRQTMERATDRFLQAIRQLLKEGCSAEADGLVPSDFQLARLDQDKLNKLSALLNKKDRSGVTSR
jgi:amino acid adenylation domain-containing protein/non-ribosomal peptide synthase protein (TIGR01720 family)